MEPLLSVTELAVRFDTRHGTVHAVDGVSFDVAPGEALGIVGESGSGKSVTVLSLLGLVPSPPGRLVGGRALFDGRDLLRLPGGELRSVRGREIGMVFQDPMTSLNPDLTVGRQIDEALRQQLGLDQRSARARTVELLDRVGIPAARRRADHYPHQFSGGMRQRAMIAMAIAGGPRLLIADEPTTALDVTIQAQIVELVRELRRETGMAVIWITHDLGVVARLCDRVVVMYAGRIAESASALDLFERPGHPYTLGLLRSVPRLDEDRRASLDPIQGMPPDLVDPPTGCAFAPRCALARDICHQPPPPREVGPRHTAACWFAEPVAPTAGVSS
jgi:oligopeptide transport system ATP-binding protein